MLTVVIIILTFNALTTTILARHVWLLKKHQEAFSYENAFDERDLRVLEYRFEETLLRLARGDKNTTPEAMSTT